MIRTILVPLDGSLLAERGLVPAGRIAAETGAALALVRVVRLPSGVDWAHQRPDVQTIEEAWTYLDVVGQRLAAGGLTVSTHVLPGEPIRTILFAAHSTGAEMISMATHGDTGLRGALLGSVAEGVARHTHLPLLLTRASVHDAPASAPFGTIIVALDGTPFAEIALTYLVTADLAARAHLVLVQAVAHASISPLPTVVPNEAITRMYAEADRRTEHRRLAAQDYLQSVGGMRLHGRTWQARVVVDDPATALKEAARAEHAELIVLTSHNRHGADLLLNGSLAQDLIRHADVPIMILHEQSAAIAGSAHLRSQAAHTTHAGEPIAQGQISPMRCEPVLAG